LKCALREECHRFLLLLLLEQGVFNGNDSTPLTVALLAGIDINIITD
jgi:hypothetical protein